MISPLDGLSERPLSTRAPVKSYLTDDIYMTIDSTSRHNSTPNMESSKMKKVSTELRGHSQKGPSLCYLIKGISLTIREWSSITWGVGGWGGGGIQSFHPLKGGGAGKTTQWSSKSRKLIFPPSLPTCYNTTCSAGSQEIYIDPKGNKPKTSKRRKMLESF